MKLESSNRNKSLVESEQILPFSFDKFKFNSPLFAGHAMTVRKLYYRGEEINEMTITLDNGSGMPISITVWDLTNSEARANQQNLLQSGFENNSPSGPIGYENTRYGTYTNKYHLQWKAGHIFYESKVELSSVHNMVIRVSYSGDDTNIIPFDDSFAYLKKLQPIIDAIKQRDF